MMANRNSRSNLQCVYCGARNSLTRDHVPPKCLFAKPLPEDLITVPSCHKCNEAASKDDEYFRMILTSRSDVGDHPEALSVMKRAVRGLQYPEARKFRRSFLRSTDMFYYVNELGVIEPGGSYMADHERLGRVASRIVEGLFWYKTRERLPRHYEVSAYVDAGLPQLNPSEIDMCEEVLREEPISVGRGVFKCWYKSVPEDRFTSFWLLRFYENIHFLCLSINSQAKPAEGPPMVGRNR